MSESKLTLIPQQAKPLLTYMSIQNSTVNLLNNVL